jgi:ribonuclease G
MLNEIIINIHPFEKRVAILEDGKLVELFVEKKNKQNVVGNIYKGIVKDVLPGMGAAFIDVGLERTAFLHYSDIVVDFLDYFDAEQPRHHRHGDSSKIGELLKPGQEIIVQVHKGPIGNKGARLTGQISIPGKYLVFFPNKNKIAISRKIASSAEKARIKGILNAIKDENVGLIVRTEAEGSSEEDFTNEYHALAKTWRLVEKQLKFVKPPECVFDENDLANTLIRDLFSSNVDRLVVDNKQFVKTLNAQLEDAAPELMNRIELYQEDSPIFDAFGIEKKIETIFQSRLYLPSGGNIRIEQTEALVAVDVNTGSFTGHSNYEETVKKTNIEAAIEIARQIRLRDLSGIMVLDFIDMAHDSSRDEVLNVLRKELRRDRAKNKVYPFGPLGLVEVTRKRMRPSLVLSYSEPCPNCNGTGKNLSRDAVVMRIHRWLSRSEYFIGNMNVRVVVHPNVRKFLLDHPDYMSSFKNRTEFVTDENLKPDQFKVYPQGEEKEITTKYNP